LHQLPERQNLDRDQNSHCAHVASAILGIPECAGDAYVFWFMNQHVDYVDDFHVPSFGLRGPIVARYSRPVKRFGKTWDNLGYLSRRGPHNFARLCFRPHAQPQKKRRGERRGEMGSVFVLRFELLVSPSRAMKISRSLTRARNNNNNNNMFFLVFLLDLSDYLSDYLSD
jgi:hypothetical protein